MVAAMITARNSVAKYCLPIKPEMPPGLPRRLRHLLAADPTVTLLDIEIAFRDGGAYSYVIAGQGKMVQVVLGMKDWLAALKAAGLSPDANRAALAAKPLIAT